MGLFDFRIKRPAAPRPATRPMNGSYPPRPAAPRPQPFTPPRKVQPPRKPCNCGR